MKNLLFLLIVLVIIVVGAFLFWNNYQISVSPRVKPIVEPPPVISEKCGVENCHGLEITCGPNVAEACTFEYVLGDRCRVYASCEIIDGECQLVKRPEFEVCKSCVEECQANYLDDMIRVSECEAECQ